MVKRLEWRLGALKIAGSRLKCASKLISTPGLHLLMIVFPGTSLISSMSKIQAVIFVKSTRTGLRMNDTN